MAIAKRGSFGRRGQGNTKSSLVEHVLEVLSLSCERRLCWVRLGLASVVICDAFQNFICHWLSQVADDTCLKDLLTMMGIPMPSRRSMHGQNLLLSPFPIELTERNIKSLTGNAMHCAVVGCLLLCILKHLKTCDT